MKHIKKFRIFESSLEQDIIKQTTEFIKNNESYKVNSEDIYDGYKEEGLSFDEFDSMYTFVLFDTLSILGDKVYDIENKKIEYFLVESYHTDEADEDSYFFYSNGEFKEDSDSIIRSLISDMEENNEVYLGNQDNIFTYGVSEYIKMNHTSYEEPNYDTEIKSDSNVSKIDTDVSNNNKPNKIMGFQPHSSMNRTKDSSKITNDEVEVYQNELLDLISAKGIKSISPKQKKFLDSFNKGTSKEVLNKIRKDAIIDDHKIGDMKDWVLSSGQYKVTVEIFRNGEDEFELNDTSNGWVSVVVNKQQMMDLYDGKLDRHDLDWE